jgi:hypothetical protein
MKDSWHTRLNQEVLAVSVVDVTGNVMGLVIGSAAGELVVIVTDGWLYKSYSIYCQIARKAYIARYGRNVARKDGNK